MDLMAKYQYTIVIEKGDGNYSAYVPDLPGCVAAADTVEETESLIREAIELHLEGMVEDGIPIPQPSDLIRQVEVELPPAA
jgi:predicted RNase H-like HicB family nuclease